VTVEGFPRTSYWSLLVISPVMPPGVHDSVQRQPVARLLGPHSELQIHRQVHGRNTQSCHLHAHGPTDTARIEALHKVIAQTR